jgi:hypothetical protein
MPSRERSVWGHLIARIGLGLAPPALTPLRNASVLPGDTPPLRTLRFRYPCFYRLNC